VKSKQRTADSGKGKRRIHKARSQPSRDDKNDNKSGDINEAYHEGHYAGFVKGYEEGHKLAYEQQL
jgi:hypothetical protein